MHVQCCLQPQVAVQHLLPISRHRMQLEQLLALRARAAPAAPHGATHSAGAGADAICGGGGGGAQVARRDEEREAKVRLHPERGRRRRSACGGRVPQQAAQLQLRQAEAHAAAAREVELHGGFPLQAVAARIRVHEKHTALRRRERAPARRQLGARAAANGVDAQREW